MAELDAIADAEIAARAVIKAENAPPVEDAPAPVVDPAAEVPPPPSVEPPAQDPPPAPAAPEDQALQTRLEIIARKTQESEAVLSKRADEIAAKLDQAKPVLDVLNRLGPNAARLLEVAERLGPLEQAVKADPLGVLLALGADTNLVAFQAMQAQLGDKAPAHVQARIAQHKADTGAQSSDQKIAALTARIDEMVNSQKMEQMRATYRQSLSTELAAASAEEAPIIKALLSDEKVAPNVVDALLNLQETHARATGSFLPVPQLIAEYEDELAKEYTADYVQYLRSKHSKAPPAASPAGTKAQTAASHAAPQQGITNKVVGSTQPPQPRLPEKKQTRAELEAEAVKYLEDRARA